MMTVLGCTCGKMALKYCPWAKAGTQKMMMSAPGMALLASLVMRVGVALIYRSRVWRSEAFMSLVLAHS